MNTVAVGYLKTADPVPSGQKVFTGAYIINGALRGPKILQISQKILDVVWGDRFLAPKSWVATILLPYVLEFSINVRGDRIAHIARLLGEDISDATPVEAPQRAIEAVRRLISSLNLPSRLREFDIGLDEMIEVAGTARSFDMMNYLPRVVSTEDIYEMIKAAY